MVKKGVPSNVVMRLLNIQYDEIFQRYYGRTLLIKQQYSYKGDWANVAQPSN